MPDGQAQARAAELGDLADCAHGLAAGLELVAECCTSFDPARVALACRVAFMLASVASDLALALADEVDGEAEAAPMQHASWLLDMAEGLAASLELIAEGCGGSDDGHATRAGRLAFTLANVADDMAMALGQEASGAAGAGLPGRPA